MADDQNRTSRARGPRSIKSSLTWSSAATYLTLGAVAFAAMAAALALGYIETFAALVGVVVGAITSAVTQTVEARRRGRLRARASALLVRSDLYAYQDWILESIGARRFTPPPSHVASGDNFVELAYEMYEWRDWQNVSSAIRSMARLSARTTSTTPARSRELLGHTFFRIERARRGLTKLDGRDGKAHPGTDEVETWTRVIRY